MSMGMCLFLDRQPEYPRSVSNAGKDLVRHDEVLTETAELLEVQPLTDFCSQSRADAHGPCTAKLCRGEPSGAGEEAEEDETVESVVMALQDMEELLQNAEKQQRFHIAYH